MDSALIPQGVQRCSLWKFLAGLAIAGIVLCILGLLLAIGNGILGAWLQLSGQL